MHRVPAVCATAHGAHAEKCLSSEQNQAMFTLGCRPVGKCWHRSTSIF
jgi:hypothetical protein